MKRLFLLLWAGLLVACNRYGAGVPAEYVPLLDSVLAASPRADSLRMVIRSTPRDERAGMAFLVAFMPQGDRDTMRLDLLRENVAYAYRARRTYPWAQALEEDVFLNEVLPYAVVDEVRDSWRPDFFERFAPCVAGCTDAADAARAVNRCVVDRTGVEYNTLREKTNQSPSESMRQGMASCTGLSVLLVDALRAVGIPARFAGTPAWHDDRGNHSWTEVWHDGRWHITEYYAPASPEKLWFLPDAGRASVEERGHGIYAVSFRPTGDWFPMAWNETSRDVHGENVAQRYRDLQEAKTRREREAGTHVEVRFRMFREKADLLYSADRVAANVDVFCGAEQVAGGRTAGPRQDMNDVLCFLLEKNRTYTFRYGNSLGETVEVTVAVGEEPVEAVGYMR